ncbi:MAG: Rv3654c family TadE-like protein [Actinomycetota bacterium]
MTAQRGSVTLLAAAVMLMVMVLVLGLADMARTLSSSARAQSAADLAALAAVQELAIPSDRTPESVAAEYSRANGAELVRCDCSPGSIQAVVEVKRTTGDLLLVPGPREVRATARAVVDLPQ